MALNTSEPVSVQPADLDQLVKDRAGVKIVDVRTPAEFEAARIPGSYNLPLDQLPHCGDELREVDAPIALVCRTGPRARQAEMLLRELGLPKVHVLEGGFQAWERAGLPVARGRARWSIERQVRAIAGGLVLIGTLGSLLVWPPLIGIAIFVGAGLLFAGLTETCGMAALLARLPYNQGAGCDVQAVLVQLKSSSTRPTT